MLAWLEPGLQSLHDGIEGRKPQRRSDWTHGLEQSAEIHSRERPPPQPARPRRRMRRRPAAIPRRNAAWTSTMAIPPATVSGSTQATPAPQPNGQPIPASRGQPGRKGRSLLADRMRLRGQAQKPKAAKPSEQQKEPAWPARRSGDHASLARPERTAMSQRPRQKEIDDCGDKLEIGAHPAAGEQSGARLIGNLRSAGAGRRSRRRSATHVVCTSTIGYRWQTSLQAADDAHQS